MITSNVIIDTQAAIDFLAEREALKILHTALGRVIYDQSQSNAGGELHAVTICNIGRNILEQAISRSKSRIMSLGIK